jgi:hypothetical protein
LNVLEFNEAVAGPDKVKWEAAAVGGGHERMLKDKVLKGVNTEEVPKKDNTMKITWDTKKKACGKFRAKMNVRGVEQSMGSTMMQHIFHL